ncbi:MULTISPECIES: DUF2312 domain-containing protein [unclassified Rhizobium]
MARKKDEFDPMAVGGGKMAAAGDDTPVSIEIPGQETIHTTMGGVKKAAEAADTKRVDGVAGNDLKEIIEGIEGLLAEKQEVGDLVKERYGNAKSRGFDTKAIRTIIRMRKQDPSARKADQDILDIYLAALGME